MWYIFLKVATFQYFAKKVYKKTDSFVLRRLNPAVLELGVATLLRVNNFLKGLPYYETENFLVNFTK